jgi:hypothetical protein
MAPIAVMDGRAQVRDSSVAPAVAHANRSRPVRVIAGADRCSSGWRLVVTSYGGSVETLELPDGPGISDAAKQLPAGCRPLAVRVDLSPYGPRSTCLVRSAAGPHRVPLSVRTALSLVTGGVHGIVTGA